MKIVEHKGNRNLKINDMDYPITQLWIKKEGGNWIIATDIQHALMIEYFLEDKYKTNKSVELMLEVLNYDKTVLLILSAFIHPFYHTQVYDGRAMEEYELENLRMKEVISEDENYASQIKGQIMLEQL